MPSSKPSKPSLPRLLRKVTGDEFPARDIVATLDMENNLVRVRQDWWDAQPVSYTHLTLPTNREV